jgi:hypothetical protein
MSEPPRVVHSSDESTAGALPKSVARAGRRAEKPQPSPHAHRFRTATAVLVGFAVGAIIVAVAVAVASTKSTPKAAAWSTWAPPDSGTQGATEIAEHVAPYYRISGTDQLDVVTVVNLESAAAAAAQAQAEAQGTTTPPANGLQVAVKPNASSSSVSLLNGNTIAYNLCGIGTKNCAIGVGTPSTSQLLLLRREALELALYTFHYIRGVENVLAILPPGRSQTTSTLTKNLPTSDSPSIGKPLNIGVLFDHEELAPLLRLPLAGTLPEQFPPTVSEMPKAPETPLVDQVTAHGLFSEQLQQAQDGSSLIVLGPLPPQ